MALKARCTTLLLTLILALLAAVAAPAQDQPDVAAASPALSPYGDTYLPEELAAIDRALWGVNMTRGDLLYKRDYTEGTGCFPVVREWMHDPLLIAPWMDRFSATLSTEAGDSNRVILEALRGTGYPIGWIDSEPAAGLDFSQADPARITQYIKNELALDPITTVSAEQLAQIRGEITMAMAWHAIDVDPNAAAAEDESEAEMTGEELYELFKLVDPIRPIEEMREPNYTIDLENMLLRLDMLHALFVTGRLPVLDQPYYFDTEFGRICIGTPGDDYYTGDFVVLIEPGGNDTYHNCRIGAAYGKRSYGPRLAPTVEPVGASADYSPLGNGHIGYFLDLGGDDYYDCADVDINLGAAVLGVAAFYDLGQGNDRYYAGSCTLGAAMGGIATFYDDGGSDCYSGKVFSQGAAGFGIGIMVDDSLQPAPALPTDVETPEPIDWRLWDNDIYEAWANSQAFARPRGVALCVNRRGNELYHAGGVYLHAPLFADRYQSFSQGFAIGERDIDWAGGIALLLDYEGNDRYLGDIYNQGVGYWYSAGLLYDGAGNDNYEMTQYGQGSGIHLAVGGLVDGAGNDTYVMHSGLGQGSSHDLAVSILHDRGGDDRYDGNTTCNGAALAGATGLFIDRAGNDTYAGRRNGSINYADTRRINIGVFVDLAGQDDFMGKFADGALWRQGNIGTGIDIAPPPAPPTEAAATAPAAAPEPPAGLAIPAICSYEGALTQEVFDELWEISIRWEVGDNRWIVPKARQRLIAFGLDVLPYLDAKMDNDNSGLAQRAYVEILTVLLEPGRAEVAAMLGRNLASDGDTRRRLALYLIGELKLTEEEQGVAALLSHEDQSLRRRAMGVLGLLGSHAGDTVMLALLDPAVSDEPMLIALTTTLCDLQADCFAQLSPLLDYPLFTVREQVVKSVDKNWEAYSPAVRAAFLNRTGLTARATRTLLYIYLGSPAAPDAELISQLPVLLADPDWGVQSDAIRLALHWKTLAADTPELSALFAAEGEIAQAIARLKATSADSLVLDLAQPAD